MTAAVRDGSLQLLSHSSCFTPYTSPNTDVIGDMNHGCNIPTLGNRWFPGTNGLSSPPPAPPSKQPPGARRLRGPHALALASLACELRWDKGMILWMDKIHFAPL